ncbi:TRAP transporter small permease [Pararhodobacter zhoushanensis]|uniref:TRAP transporter small permease protein n=1 Tax=Pararhodobacter zhoushanensis TaxID=2479545 RepID=A0ABT3GU27_9RHOB|nr:TRAP transporter small permease subunit [Pararhodobacter zhoushanensis]MCW1931053.1 TRAP transporter small permease subunit [Pararhodobacter zhoushanensis]
MEALDRLSRRATQWLALLGFAGLLLLALMTSLDALLRSAFSAPIHGVNDVSAVVMAVVISACIPANLAQRRNITVEVLGSLLGKTVNQVLTLFAGVVVLVVIGLMAWKFIPYTEGMYLSGRQTWVLAWPVWPWWAAATLFLIFAAFVQALNVFADVMALIRMLRTRPADALSSERGLK